MIPMFLPRDSWNKASSGLVCPFMTLLATCRTIISTGGSNRSLSSGATMVVVDAVVVVVVDIVVLVVVVDIRSSGSGA